jgi:hypothetical protein
MARNFKRHPVDEVESVEGLLSSLGRLQNDQLISSATWFRGASKCYRPLPTIGCPYSYASTEKHRLNWIDERNILHRFRRRVQASLWHRAPQEQRLWDEIDW